MQVYHIEGEILTPVHIASGEEIEPYDYVIRESTFHKINLSDFILSLSAEDQEEFNELLGADLIKLRNFIKDKVDVKQFGVFSADVSPDLAARYEDKIIDDKTMLMVTPFIRDMSGPYLPGSSLKGALRTAVIFKLFPGRSNQRQRGDLLEAELLRCERGFYDKRAKKFVTRGLDAQKDPFRAIKIADALLPEGSTQIRSIDTFSKKAEGITPIEFSIHRETTHAILAGQSLTFTTEFRFDRELLQRASDIKEKSIDKNFIVQACNKFAQQVIRNELEGYWGDHPTSKIYQQLRDYELSDNECLLRIGWGSGFDSMTVNLKQKRPEFVKTRKLIDGHLPLGWVKLRFVEVSN